MTMPTRRVFDETEYWIVMTLPNGFVVCDEEVNKDRYDEVWRWFHTRTAFRIMGELWWIKEATCTKPANALSQKLELTARLSRV